MLINIINCPQIGSEVNQYFLIDLNNYSDIQACVYVKQDLVAYSLFTLRLLSDLER